MLGKSGGKLWPIPEQQWKDLITYIPDVVFWCLGGNSISVDVCPADVVKEILQRVETLKESGVKKVYVSEISQRGCFKKSKGLTKGEFDDKRRVINRRLQQKLKDEFVTIPSIKYTADYDSDLVHFGQKMGLKDSENTFSLCTVFCCHTKVLIRTFLTGTHQS